MMIIATQIRIGMILVYEGEMARVTWMMHRTPGKGPASMQTRLKNIMTGKNLEARFRTNDKVEKADLRTRDMQYLYSDDTGLIFMDPETFDQHTLSKELAGDSSQYLADGNNYPITFYEDQAVGLELPTTMIFKVISAPPEIKKATATKSLRPVTLDNGMVIQAPAFISEGDRVKVNTEDGSYVERVRG